MYATGACAPWGQLVIYPGGRANLNNILFSFGGGLRGSTGSLALLSPVTAANITVLNSATHGVVIDGARSDSSGWKNKSDKEERRVINLTCTARLTT